MRPTTLSVLAALTSCALTLGILHHLRARKQGEYWWLREQNDRMRYEAYQRDRSVRAILKETPRVVPALSPAPAAQDNSTGAQYGYHDAGMSTPADSLQTFVWACERVDTEKVARMLMMEEAEHRKAEVFLAAQPPEVRAKWGTVEALAARLLILSTLANSFPSSEVLAASPVDMQGEDRAVCGAVRKATFRKVGDVWKYELGAGQMESLYREVAQALAQPQAR
jgi:hypothetical protein